MKSPKDELIHPDSYDFSFMLEPFGTGLCPVSFGFANDGSGVPERHLPSGPDPRSISGTWEVVPSKLMK